MKVRITNHAVDRYCERVEKLTDAEVYLRIEELLATSIDLSGARLRAIPNRDPRNDYWLNEQANLIFVVDLSSEDAITVVTVLNQVHEAPKFRRGQAQRRSGKGPKPGHEFRKVYRRQKRVNDD